MWDTRDLDACPEDQQDPAELDDSVVVGGGVVVHLQRPVRIEDFGEKGTLALIGFHLHQPWAMSGIQPQLWRPICLMVDCSGMPTS